MRFFGLRKKTSSSSASLLSMVTSAPAKCFFVTGPPGVGKSTLVMRILETLKSSHPNLNIRGFYTREIREGSDRVGFEVVTMDGRCGPLASSKVSSAESLGWPTVGKYKVDIASFDSLVLPELQVREGTDLFVIDEVGKMELFSSSFFPAVLRVLQADIPILASIPIPRFGRDIPSVARLRNHPGGAVFTLDTENRDTIKDTIYAQLVNLLPKC
ncbi:cancer-related nucleoside-triphosphatase-like protein isoform X1 [Iris pallida]|uniref:Cancer-related nucleoside-triphosphatase-like protein isoform X1 n=1 Tax=Iris pallida TaxID=29817 RepID=A0AAX6F6G6_IRIPA|nr:cancer-related nucleoside-triphosphatase-like protein isoform X1 [Iris pallida]